VELIEDDLLEQKALLDLVRAKANIIREENKKLEETLKRLGANNEELSNMVADLDKRLDAIKTDIKAPVSSGTNWRIAVAGLGAVGGAIGGAVVGGPTAALVAALCAIGGVAYKIYSNLSS
jgi:hypothetical protein